MATKKETKVPQVYLRDDKTTVLVRLFNGIHGYTLAECSGYNGNGEFNHAAALRVAEVCRAALQEQVDAKINPLRVTPPTPNETESCFDQCPFAKLLKEMCNATKK